jgi:ribonuclease D
MLITKTKELEDFCGQIAGASYVTVDTEFIRERTYWPKLCLVQVAIEGHAAAIDTMAPGLDLSPLFKLMRNEAVLKVFHSAGQDLTVFHSVMGDIPKPLFDTQLAAMVCGYGEQPAYATLVSAIAGEAVDKASQMTDWSRRPLTDRQIEYALSDVTFLIPVYESLCKQLKAAGRSDWVDEEIELMSQPDSYVSEPSEQWRRIRIRRPNRKSLAVLREIAEWRELAAQQRDLPRAWVMRDDSLAEIAANRPVTVQELERVRGITPKFSEGRDGAAVLAAVAKALDSDPDTWPDVPPRSDLPDASDTMIALLQALLRVRADENNVAAALVANRRDIEQIAVDDDADVAALKGWRRKVFGEDALRLKRGEIGITSLNGRAVAVDMDGLAAQQSTYTRT